MRYICTAALFLSMAASAVTPAAAQEKPSKRIERCSLLIAGDEFIGGPCDFTVLDDDGSFQIMSTDGAFFAQVDIVAPGEARGYWNEDAGANHAHSPLGTLYRDGACWRDGEAVDVCAW